MCNGVLPVLFFAVTSAPKLNNSCIASVWPFLAAMCNGVSPSFLCAFTLAPKLFSSCIAAVWPLKAAPCNGVQPSSFFAFTSAPKFFSSCIAIVWPLKAARCIVVQPRLFFAFTSGLGLCRQSCCILAISPIAAASLNCRSISRMEALGRLCGGDGAAVGFGGRSDAEDSDDEG